MVKQIKPHRVLAINRGENEKVLKVSIDENTAFVLSYIYTDLIKVAESFTAPHVTMAIDDAYKRLIKPSIEREIRSELKDKAEDQAIHIFIPLEPDFYRFLIIFLFISPHRQKKSIFGFQNIC